MFIAAWLAIHSVRFPNFSNRFEPSWEEILLWILVADLMLLLDFTGFHEVHMAGLSDTLKAKGKLVNKSSVPYSIGD